MVVHQVESWGLASDAERRHLCHMKKRQRKAKNRTTKKRKVQLEENQMEENSSKLRFGKANGKLWTNIPIRNHIDRGAVIGNKVHSIEWLNDSHTFKLSKV